MEVKRLGAVLALAIVVAACGDNGGETSPPGGPVETAVGETGDEPGAAGEFAMPDALADHPLPDDAQIPFPPTDLSAEQDPRETLQVTVISRQSFDAVAQVIDSGLPANGYTVEESQISDTALTFWEWTKDGLPGVTTAGTNATGDVTINVNLFRSGTR